MSVRIEADNGLLALFTPYNQGLVAMLKQQIPYQDREWVKDKRCWRVAPQYGAVLESLIMQFFGQAVQAPQVEAVTTTVTTILNMRYLGRAKERGNGQETATGFVDGGWNAIFPKAVLMTWFGQSARPGEAHSLYAALGVNQATAQSDLKKAYRRMARQWHPDVCLEPDAHEQFQRIQHAWEILKDPISRGKYDAGLALEAAFRARNPLTEEERVTGEWAPPLRCGFVLVKGVRQMGRIIVDEILQWEDIANGQGQVLVSSWPVGAEMFQEVWV